MPASAARSGNPAKRAATKKAAAGSRALTVSSVDDWGTDEGELIELPSGKVVRIERVPLTNLLSEGLLGDSLSGMAAKAVQQGQGMDAEEVKGMAQDPAKVAEALDAFDKVAAKCIIEPEVHYYKHEDGQVIPKAERLSGVLYTDKIDLEDKIFIFNVISGGSSDLQRFREQFSQSMAGISAS